MITRSAIAFLLGSTLLSALLVGFPLPAAGLQVVPPSADTVDLGSVGYTQGPESARVKVAEFSDFACGFCKQFHDSVFPGLVEKHVATGNIQWRYVPVVLGLNREATQSTYSNGVQGARAGYCAGDQDRFRQMRDRLFGSQQEWTRLDDPEDTFVGYARDLGMDTAAFMRCYRDPLTIQRIVRASELATALNLRATPSFWVVGLGPLQGVQPITTWDTIVERIGGG